MKQSKQAAKKVSARPNRLVVMEYDKKKKNLIFMNLHVLG